MGALAFLGAMALPTAARAEWQFSAGAGASYTASSDLRIRQGTSDYTVEGVSWSGRSMEMPIWYDLRVTYFLPTRPELGFTVGLLHAKVHARTGDARRIRGTMDGAPIDTVAPMDDYIQNFEISNGVNFLEFGVVGRLRWSRSDGFPDGRIHPYLGLATGPVINHAENVVAGTENEADFHQNPSWGTQGMLGVQYSLTKDWKLYGELKRTHVSADVDVAGGRAETTLDTTHLSTGLVFVF